jgi:hypothetical protein
LLLSYCHKNITTHNLFKLQGQDNMKKIQLIVAVHFCVCLFFTSTSFSSETKAPDHSRKPQKAGIPKYFVPSPPFTEGIFPCSECHADMEVNREKRDLEMNHENIVLKHAGPQQWCFDCHNPDDRDKLRLIDGRLISFEESYLLCGQCHGTIFRDWKAGVHGKRTGEWNGNKLYRLCVHCHNPHQPPFKQLKPKPPPVRPEDIK